MKFTRAANRLFGLMPDEDGRFDFETINRIEVENMYGKMKEHFEMIQELHIRFMHFRPEGATEAAEELLVGQDDDYIHDIEDRYYQACRSYEAYNKQYINSEKQTVLQEKNERDLRLKIE